jgi:protein FRG1
LKGEKKKLKSHKKSKKRKHEEEVAGEAKRVVFEDRAKHGGWWSVNELGQISGAVAIEFGDLCYVKALDDGTFTLGSVVFAV